MVEQDMDSIKGQIINALQHPEAEEGLYFHNLFHLHEEDERPAVIAPQEDILEALKELMNEGKIQMSEESVFHLVG